MIYTDAHTDIQNDIQTDSHRHDAVGLQLVMTNDNNRQRQLYGRSDIELTDNWNHPLLPPVTEIT